MDVFTTMDWGLLIAALLVLGAVAGFLAGLLGIGGGIVLVPGLYWAFAALGFDPDEMMHVAVGTSLAIIIPTGLVSARAHWNRGAVRMDLVRRIGPGIIIGVAIGTYIAHLASGETLKIIFGLALLAFAVVLQLRPERLHVRDDIPPQPWTGLASAFIGILATLMGIGGATMNVPFMTVCGIPIHTAVGTSSALGPLIAIPGTLGFIIIGLDAANLPPYSLGYISLPALLVIAPMSAALAPHGAAAAHKLSIRWLRQVFALFLVIVAVKMLWESFGG